MLDKMKQLWEMQKKMQELKRELERTQFEVNSHDGLVKIVMNGSQQVQEIKLSCGPEAGNAQRIEKAVKDAVNSAIKRSQEIAAEKMKSISGLNLPGL
jgi:DNA-binding YbaB/EbfC family protein